MIDMSQFIAARSDQLNADDLMDSPRTITITKVTASPDAAEQPVAVHYEGDNGRPLKPCKTVRRIMVGVWGKDASKYVGRSMTLYRDPTVAFGGMQVGGIRVSHMSDIDEKKTVALQVTRGRKAPFSVLPLDRTAVGNAGPSPTTDDAAERWVNAYIGKLQEFTTLEKIAAFENEKAAKLAELKTARPELHERLAAATEARRNSLSASGFDDDDLTADTASEKTAAEAAVDQLLARAAAAADKDTLNAIIAEAEPHKAFMPEDLAMRLEIAFDKERRRIEPELEPAQ